MKLNSLITVAGISLGLVSFAGAEEKKKEGEAKAEAPKKEAAHPALKDPSKAKEKAPEKFKAKFETTAGDFTIEVTRDWSPLGADRFYNLVKIGYFEDIVIFRAIDGFMAQFGIHGDPSVSRIWRNARLQDDPTGKASNVAYTISFATSGPNSRTTQMFINFDNNDRLDRMGFTPFGKVVEGKESVDKIHTGYGEGKSRSNPRGKGPDQQEIQAKGNDYMKKGFPELTVIKSVSLVKE